MLKGSDVARYIDYTLLRQDVIAAQMDVFCDEAVKHAFFAVCVNPVWVSRCFKRLAGSGIKVCTVAGFPLGASDSGVKAFEAGMCIEHGADEIDMVINIGALKDGDLDTVERDIRSVADVCGSERICKVIIETCLLSKSEIVTACHAVMGAGADFVKTSTGLAGGGATVEDVAFIRGTVGPEFGVKAAGGIKTFESACAMINAGASRIGTSAGPVIVAECGG